MKSKEQKHLVSKTAIAPWSVQPKIRLNLELEVSETFLNTLQEAMTQVVIRNKTDKTLKKVRLELLHIDYESNDYESAVQTVLIQEFAEIDSGLSEIIFVLPGCYYVTAFYDDYDPDTEQYNFPIAILNSQYVETGKRTIFVFQDL